MKNKLLFLVAIISFSINVNAQTNLYPIEDPWFLAYLQESYPQTIVNDSLDIDATGGIDTLNLPFTPISFTNIDPVQFFDDLTYLNCWGQDITSLPELPDGLKVLRCSGNQLSSLPELPNGLIWLSCGLNLLTSLPDLPEALGILSCNQNNLTSLPLLPQNLSIITFFGNPLECVSNHLPQLTELHSYPICYGCTDPLYLEYEALAADDDGSCTTIISEGCMDVNADNFDESANISGACDYSCPLTATGTSYLDGLCYNYVWTYGYTVEQLEGGYDCSCVENPIYGCMDSLACNYDTIATLDDGFCVYQETYYNCNGDCIDDSDGDGVCDVLEIAGCTDIIACNYDASATEDNETCVYAETYYNCNGGCINDIDLDGLCDELEILGCTDTIACNYDVNATEDNETCIYAVTYYGCNGDCIYDTDLDGVCDELEISGCTDTDACNYNASATDDDVSCIYAEIYYDCNGLCINDIDLDGDCDEFDYDDGLSIDDVVIEEPKLIKMIDVLGRAMKEHKKGVLLFYIYDNGRVAKRMIYQY